MAHGKLIDSSKLNSWINNFRTNADLGFTTNSATVSLEQLENFIIEAKEKYPSSMNGFRIYFVRYSLADGGPNLENIKQAGKNLSQPSLVLVPVKNYGQLKGTGNDFVLDNPGDLYVLAFSEPDSTDPDDSTTLCPPKCG